MKKRFSDACSNGECCMRLVFDAARCVGCQSCMFACSRRQNIAGLTGTCLHVRSAGGFTRGFSGIVCRACEDPPCAKVCPTDALEQKDSGGVILHVSKCIGCGNCRDACLIGAVFWNDETEKPAICIHCGFCVRYCPHGVLKIEGKEMRENAQG
jgi:Fe-S-cluster-containing dehydrogenase component